MTHLKSADRFDEIVEARGRTRLRRDPRTWPHGRAEIPRPGRLGVPAADQAAISDSTILGSGDVFTAEDAVRMLRETGVDIVWIARGAIGNPWIFQHAQTLLRRSSAMLAPPSIHEQRDALASTSPSRWRSTASSSPADGCGRWGSSTAGFIRRRRREAGVHQRHSLRDWTNVLDRFYASTAPASGPRRTRRTRSTNRINRARWKYERASRTEGCPTDRADAGAEMSSTDWIWWTVLVVSCVVGFGMTIFARRSRLRRRRSRCMSADDAF